MSIKINHSFVGKLGGGRQNVSTKEGTFCFATPPQVSMQLSKVDILHIKAKKDNVNYLKVSYRI